jgi:hypothetical protein
MTLWTLSSQPANRQRVLEYRLQVVRDELLEQDAQAWKTSPQS